MIDRDGASLAFARMTDRRDLLVRAARWLGTLPFVAVFLSAVRNRDRARPPRRILIVPDYRDGVAISDEVIVSRDANTRGVPLASACSHLGCRISRIEGDELVCPCHGSRFRRDGTVVAGPATRPLTALRHDVDPDSGALSVDVS